MESPFTLPPATPTEVGGQGGPTYLMVRWRLLGGGGKDEGGPLLRSSTDCSSGLLFSEPGAPLSVDSILYLWGLECGWRPAQQGP